MEIQVLFSIGGSSWDWLIGGGYLILCAHYILIVWKVTCHCPLHSACYEAAPPAAGASPIAWNFGLQHKKQHRKNRFWTFGKHWIFLVTRFWIKGLRATPGPHCHHLTNIIQMHDSIYICLWLSLTLPESTSSEEKSSWVIDVLHLDIVAASSRDRHTAPDFSGHTRNMATTGKQGTWPLQ